MTATSLGFGLTVVVPSFNQALFIEQTLDSILSQNKPWVKIIVIDGGSTDGTIKILSKYSKFLHYSHSRPDNGQVDAIHQGFLIANTPWICWQNSDDLYTPTSFDTFFAIVDKHPNIDLVFGDLNLIDQDSNLIRTNFFRPLSFDSLLVEGMLIANQSSFFRKEAYLRIGGLNSAYDLAFDYEFFLRYSSSSFTTYYVPSVLGSLRLHDLTKTSTQVQKFQDEISSVRACFSYPTESSNFSRAKFKFLRVLYFLLYLPSRIRK
jgi:glycosyltransferase involved in cell wall biosynthesis